MPTTRKRFIVKKVAKEVAAPKAVKKVAAPVAAKKPVAKAVVRSTTSRTSSASSVKKSVVRSAPVKKITTPAVAAPARTVGVARPSVAAKKIVAKSPVVRKVHTLARAKAARVTRTAAVAKPRTPSRTARVARSAGNHVKRVTITTTMLTLSAPLNVGKKAGLAAKNIKKLPVFPEFEYLDDIVRFASVMYLFALSPLAYPMLSPLRDLNNPPALSQMVASAPVEVSVASEESAPVGMVAGVETVAYPEWEVALYRGDEAVETIAQPAEALELMGTHVEGATEKTPSRIVWTSTFRSDIEDLYNFFVSSNGTAKVYVDDVLVVDKVVGDIPSSSAAHVLTQGSHSFRVEYTPAAADQSFQFLFY